MSALRLGRVQLRIMQVLWKRERANAREITEDMNKISPIAHSTVQTLLRKLESKGAVDHDIEDRTFIFYPLIQEDEVTNYSIRDLVNRMFQGSPAGLVSYLIKNEEISPEEMEQLRELINE